MIELDNPSQKMPVKGLKRSDSVTAKTLFYPQKTQRRINDLISLLQPGHTERRFAKGIESQANLDKQSASIHTGKSGYKPYSKVWFNTP